MFHGLAGHLRIEETARQQLFEIGGEHVGTRRKRTEPIARHFDRKADCCAVDATPEAPAKLIRVSRLMLEALAGAGLEGSSVLDLGCGQGPFSLAVLEHGAERVTGIDLSPMAIEVARARAAAAGLGDRARFLVGDAAAEDVPAHDVVVLNRVICCYPDVDDLLRTSLAATGRVYGVIVPASSGLWGLLSRMALGFENLLRVVRRDPFRAYVHPVERVDQAAAGAGLVPTRRSRRRIWRLAVYVRPTGATATS